MKSKRTQSKNFSISLSNDIFERLEERVYASRSTRSEFIQRCVIRFLDSEGVMSDVPVGFRKSARRKKR